MISQLVTTHRRANTVGSRPTLGTITGRFTAGAASSSFSVAARRLLIGKIFFSVSTRVLVRTRKHEIGRLVETYVRGHDKWRSQANGECKCLSAREMIARNDNTRL